MNLKSIFTAVLMFVAIASFSQQKSSSDSAKKVIKEEGYEMKQYFFVMLTRGDNRTQDSATAARLQQGHMDNINRLATDGKIMVAGPFGDNGNWRGIFIFDATTKEEVEGYLNTDPAVKAGRLAYEIKPWWTAKNCVFK